MFTIVLKIIIKRRSSTVPCTVFRFHLTKKSHPKYRYVQHLYVKQVLSYSLTNSSYILLISLSTYIYIYTQKLAANTHSVPHVQNLYEYLILNIISLTIEEHLVKEQAGFRPGKSFTNKLLNLNQHIEDGYQEGNITRTDFVDLSAAYNTENHRLLIQNSTTLHKTVNCLESSRTCCPTKDSM